MTMNISHQELRMKVWTDTYIAAVRTGKSSLKGLTCLADRCLEDFDKRFTSEANLGGRQ